MSQPYDLTQLDSNSFEHLVNFLALKVLGNGVTGFASGADGGKDGFLSGRAPYPTSVDNWEGIWYIQSKFHKPHLTADSQKWLIGQVKKEIEQFKLSSKRSIPDNWIIATNIEPSGAPRTGCYDQIIEIAHKHFPDMKVDIWGGRKILDYLTENPSVAIEYGHFLTPGHIISELYKKLQSPNNQIKDLIEHLIINQFKELSYTKLEQAGSGSDQRPKIYELFKDLPMITSDESEPHFIMNCLVSSASNVQKLSTWHHFGEGWRIWSNNPLRARVHLLKGGPGQGKSTAGQYFAQIQKAFFILSTNGPVVTPLNKEIAIELKNAAINQGYWPTVPRIPLLVELKDFAAWYIKKSEHEPRGVVAYICEKIKTKIKTSHDITANVFCEALKESMWFVNFDGLDEVPNDLKDNIANEVIEFTNELIPKLNADVLVLCTTRPQGYSGQFEDLDSSVETLLPLPRDIALNCASAVVKYNRSDEDAEPLIEILNSAMNTEQVRELMITPLQSHIMAVVVREGGRPPEKRWELFNNFYSVMKKRESLKNSPDTKISELLREKDQLLKAIHDRLGISLHVRAENSDGAVAALDKSEFQILAEQTSSLLLDGNIEDVVQTLMEATIERLVFVNTPESSNSVRFDIRQLQEFFAAEFIYSAVDDIEFRRRFNIICGDSHWREVVHFLLSALVHHKRLSVLAIAVSLILQLDDDSENHYIRAFNKRMGIGSLLTLRLLEEGIFEQDKGIRQHFNKTLTPLWNSIEHSTLRQLTALNKAQSLNWLINNMVDAFIELDFSEHISTGYLLSIMLDSTHPRINEVKIRFQQAPEFYLKATLILQTGSYRRPQKKCQPWFINFLIKTLFSENTKSFPLLLEIYFYFINIDTSTMVPLEDLDITDEQRNIMNAIFFANKESTSHDKKAAKEYSFLSVVPYTHNWNTKDNELIPNFEISDTPYSSPINLFIFAVKFCRFSNAINFRNLINSIVENKYFTDAIPSYLRALIPIQFDSSTFDDHMRDLQNLNDEEMESYLANITSGVKIINPEIEMTTVNMIPYSNESWIELCNDFPDLALRVLTESYWENQELLKLQSSYDIEFYKPILNIAISNTDLFSKYFSGWAAVFRTFPEHEKIIRQKLLSCDIKYGDDHFRVSGKNILFNIEIVTEKKFVIVLAHTLLQSNIYNMYSRVSRSRVIRDDFNEEFINKYSLDNDSLISFAKSTLEDDIFRSACLSLIISQKNIYGVSITQAFFDEGLDIIFFEIFNEDSKKMLNSAAYQLLLSVTSYDIKLMEFIGRLSLLIKDDIEERLMIQNIYLRWRERSSAPVLKSNDFEHWLNYTY